MISLPCSKPRKRPAVVCRLFNVRHVHTGRSLAMSPRASVWLCLTALYTRGQGSEFQANSTMPLTSRNRLGTYRLTPAVHTHRVCTKAGPSCEATFILRPPLSKRQTRSTQQKQPTAALSNLSAAGEDMIEHAFITMTYCVTMAANNPATNVSHDV